MSEIFLKVLNMSIAASWLIAAVMLLRFALKKAPKWILLPLWGIVALRLAVPFSIESVLSLIPSAETFSPQNIQYETPAISSGIPAVNDAVNPVLGETFTPTVGDSVNPLYAVTFAASIIWLVGIAAMLLYAAISYARVHRSVSARVLYKENIFLCDYVKSPFILGIVKPKIYLPSNMSAAAMEPVIAHEKAHLARHDHWWKPLGFLILTVHWFNPLCWIAYALLCRDIELACDEKVIRLMDIDGKKQYSAALLECGQRRRLVAICPLAFGEVGIKERVKNVLNYKKPAFWVIVAAVIACAVVTVCFATNPKDDDESESDHSTVQATIVEVEDGSFLVTPVEGSWELSSSDLFRVYITNMPSSPEPQVGDILEITYDGSIQETDPAVFNEVYSMKVVSQGVTDDVSAFIAAHNSDTPNQTESLREKYPEYFDLSVSNGLEVYVWQMSETNYRFGLLEGPDHERTLEELMSLQGATAEEMSLILSTYDINDEDITVVPWGNPISSYIVTEETMNDPEYVGGIRAMLGLDSVPAEPDDDTDTQASTEPDEPTPASTEDDVVTADGAYSEFIDYAIMEHNKSNWSDYDTACASFIELSELSGTPAVGSDTHQITYYGWALYEEFKVTDNGLEEVSGSHVPVAISCTLDDSGFTLTEYWEPRDGDYYESDIRSKFPSDVAEDALDSQKFILRQTQECYASAVTATGLDTDSVIGKLFGTFDVSQSAVSNPNDYIDDNPIEYRELTYYGRYTLEYCFARFENGGETGLRGQIMARACEDISLGWGEGLLLEFSLPSDGILTGQMWYSAFKYNALSLLEQYDKAEIAELYPASYVLLGMLGEI